MFCEGSEPGVKVMVVTGGDRVRVYMVMIPLGVTGFMNRTSIDVEESGVNSGEDTASGAGGIKNERKMVVSLRTDTCTHACTHTHARTHACTHTHTHTHTDTHSHTLTSLRRSEVTSRSYRRTGTILCN